MLSTHEDSVGLWDIFKHEILEAAKEWIREITSSRVALSLGRHQRVSRRVVLPCLLRTVTSTRKIRDLRMGDEERYVRSLAEYGKDHWNANDLGLAYSALKNTAPSLPPR